MFMFTQADIVRETEKAVLVDLGRGEQWFPRKLLTLVERGDNFGNDYQVPGWFMDRNGVWAKVLTAPAH